MNKQTAITYAKKYWPVILIILIMVAGFSVRLLDYRWPYLRNIDSYNFYREIDNIVNNNGVMPGYDPLILPPQGSGTPGKAGPFVPYQYLAAYSYMIFRSVSPLTQLWQFLVWYPAFLAALMAIPMYFVGKYLYNRKAGVLAAFFMVFDISIMARTLGGDPDNDAIVLLLPLIIMALFLYSYKLANKIKTIKSPKLWISSIITGLVFGVWILAWAGQWFLLWLIGGFFIVKILFEIIRTRKIKQVIIDLKIPILSLIVILAIYFLIGTIALGTGFPGDSIRGPFSFGDIKGEENRDFPNVYVSVAELQNPADIRDVIQRVTAVNISLNPIASLVSPFFLMIYGLIYLFYSYIKRREHFDTLILLLIWFIGPLIATLIATRFSILFSAPMAICSAIFIVMIYEKLTEAKKVHKEA